MPALAALAAAAVLLGSPSYVPNGQRFGTEQPSVIYNGGAPSGMVSHIHWTGWDEPVARGSGVTPIYKPQGGYFAHRGQIRLRAHAIGGCPDGTASAYTQLSFRVAAWPGGPLGPWMKWSGSKTLCSFEDAEPGTPPGICSRVGSRDYTPGTMFD